MAIVEGRSFADAVLGNPSRDEQMLDMIMDFCTQAYNRMEAEGIGKAELAERLGKTPSSVTRVLSGSANITLRTMGEYAEALGMHLKIRDEAPRAAPKEALSCQGAQAIPSWGSSPTVRFSSPKEGVA